MSNKTTNSKSNTSAAQASTQKGNTIMDQPIKKNLSINNRTKIGQPYAEVTIINFLNATEEHPAPYWKVTKDNIIREKNYYKEEQLFTTKTQLLTQDAEGNYYIIRANPEQIINEVIDFNGTKIPQQRTVNDIQTKIINRINYQLNTNYKTLMDLIHVTATISEQLTDEGYSYFEFTNFRPIDRIATLLPEDNQ